MMCRISVSSLVHPPNGTSKNISCFICMVQTRSKSAQIHNHHMVVKNRVRPHNRTLAHQAVHFKEDFAGRDSIVAVYIANI